MVFTPTTWLDSKALWKATRHLEEPSISSPTLDHEPLEGKTSRKTTTQEDAHKEPFIDEVMLGEADVLWNTPIEWFADRLHL